MPFCYSEETFLPIIALPPRQHNESETHSLNVLVPGSEKQACVWGTWLLLSTPYWIACAFDHVASSWLSACLPRDSTSRWTGPHLCPAAEGGGGRERIPGKWRSPVSWLLSMAEEIPGIPKGMLLQQKQEPQLSDLQLLLHCLEHSIDYGCLFSPKRFSKPFLCLPWFTTAMSRLTETVAMWSVGSDSKTCFWVEI